ncbi:ROK family protein [Vibrio sp. HN007]|uniref:ROK family protein n=1 Tax=Vibrio iocasae TaxID=3098914 RepID=UPI0035D3F24A
MTKHYLVLDFGGSSVKCAVMTSDACIVEQFSVESQAESYQQWIESFAPVFERYSLSYRFEGIAISSCGAVDVDSGYIHGASSLPYIHGIDVRALFQSKFELPTELENDACCAALAEAWLGAGAHSNYFCTAVIGSGIGGAIVSGQQVLKGHHLHGGEFGFAISEYRDGMPVTWGQLASTRALVESAARALNLSSNDLNGQEVFRLYDKGDQLVTDVVEQWFLHLAVGIYNIQYHVDPELILLGGAVSKREGFVAKINQKLDGILEQLPISKVRPVVKVSKYGNDANLIGALKHFLNRQGS